MIKEIFLIPKKKLSDKRNKFLFREEEGKLIIQCTHVLYILGSIEKRIYELIDDKRNIKEIIKNLSVLYDEEERVVINDVIAFLRDLEQHKLIYF